MQAHVYYLAGEEGSCDPYQNICEDGAVCLNYKVDVDEGKGNGQCHFASAKYVPSYSTAVKCKVRA